jgi:RHS repeat-associated protein
MIDASTLSTTVSEPGQYLWVVDMGDPTDPELLAQPIVTYRVGSVVPKVVWSPPYLVYQEFGSDIQQLVYVNLQAMLIGFGSTPTQVAQFTTNYPGFTTNADGSYIGPGNKLPLPALTTTEFFGYQQSLVLQNTTQPILDFSVDDGGGIVGITLPSGSALNSHNVITTNLPPMYRTLVYGSVLNTPLPTDAAFSFGPAAYPRWVSVFGNVNLLVSNVPSVRSVALVSLVPDSDGVEKLAVIDITLPENPVLLNEISIPTSLLGGDMQSVSMRPDGLLELAGTQNLLVLDPTQLAVTNFPAGQLSPAIVSFIPGAGGIQRSLGSSVSGVHAVADNGHNEVVQSAPQLKFVNFPQNGSLVDPHILHLQNDASLTQLFANTQNPAGLAPARLQPVPSLGITSDLAPQPNPALHYYVLLQAPGAAGPTIDLGLEALNMAGWPLANLGAGFAPVRAVSQSTQTAIGQVPKPGCGAPISALIAYRLSANVNSIYYNYYLSEPFAMITEAVSINDLTIAQRNAGVDRQILFGGFQLRAFIDPDETNNAVLGPFAAQADPNRQLIYPISVTSLPTVDRSYIPGHNPPPPGGAATLPGTFEAICAHSSELRTSATDMELPSPHMPIVIEREIGTQDTYEGPFGVGWDFNYNQRLTVLTPLTFPAGLQIPVVVRDTPADSETAGSKDILFNNGMGRTFIFRWISTSMPPEYSADPLVQQEGFQNYVSDYYLPPPGQGVFDLMVKFSDGRFERLTPDGTRYQYTSQGRLEAIYDRFPANYQWLSYDSHSRLIRIDDDSVQGPRYVLFGYYRLESPANQITDPDFTQGLDMGTTDSYLDGKICRLADYAGRDVLYQYDDNGFMTNMMGIMVNGENGGYAGRSHTFYTYSGCRLVQVSATVNATPILSANDAMNTNGEPVAQSTSGIGGPVNITMPLQNTAANLAQQVSAAGLSDGSTAQYTFNKFGNPTSTTISGKDGTTSTTVPSHSEEGLLTSIQYPEGNFNTLTYDSNNAVLRSRANLLSVVHNPGSRGGTAYSETFQYDSRYNLKSGDQVDGNGFTTTYGLSGDGLTINSIAYGSAGTETFAYNASGQLTASTDVEGVTKTMTYDSQTGFESSYTLGDSSHTYTYTYGSDIASQLGRPASITLPVGSPIQLTYNANLQSVQMQRSTLVENFAYDELGHPIYHQTQLGDGTALVVQSQFDAKGFLWTNILIGVELNGQPTPLEYDYTPDPLSRVATIRHPQGTLQTFQYNSRGNVTNMTVGDYVEQFSVDRNNNVTAVYQGGDLVKTNVYDGFDRPITVIRKTGAQDETESETYYPEGQVNSRTVADDQFGTVVQQTYDQIDTLGRPVHLTIAGTTISPAFQYAYPPGSMTITEPRMTTTRTWNTAGYTTGSTDPILTATYHPDGNGRISEIDKQEDGATYNDYFVFDGLDHRTSETDNLGRMNLYSPRADGRLLGMTNAIGHATSFANSVLGELLDKRRQDGMEFRYQHDAERQTSYSGDPGAGFNFGYDGDFRLTNSTLRNGALSVYGNFDPRQMPQTVNIPGNGTITRAYDLQRRMTNKVVNYQSTTYQTSQSFDALNRLRIVTYQQDQSALNTASYTYDEAGPLLSANFKEDVGNFTVQYAYYADATRQSIIYPSGVTVTENRDTSGRLTNVSDAHGNIVNVQSWQGNRQPKIVQLGKSMQIVNSYDVRGRITGSRTTRLSDGAVLTHLRYQYDAADNQQIRQFVHRDGKADNLFYDTGERLSQAQIGTTPLNSNGFTVPLINRYYNYHLAGLDYLTTTTASNLTPLIPLFATNWTSHDNFLLPTVVDGFVRGSADPMGNVAQALLQVRPIGASVTTPVAATLTNNGIGSLVNITLSNGLTEQNFFQPNGLRYEKRVSSGSQILDFRHFVYDDHGRLLEEYEQTNATTQLIARYYYGFTDAPDAADLLDPVSGSLNRYYFLKDNMQSVVAVADISGVVVERVWYDPFGQPAIEVRDTLPPVIQSISGSSDGGSLLVALSESVGAPNTDPGPGGGVVDWPSISTNIISISVGSSNLVGDAQLLPTLPGYPPYSVLQFALAEPLPETNTVTVTLNPGTVSDEWGNSNVLATVSFKTTNQTGGVYYQPQPAPNTAAVPVARSSVGSPFLFHGQYFDYDTGLVYLRARFYDPYSGMFFEPDPMGYEDSVNMYAGMGNDPVGMRDPTGLGVGEMLGRLVGFLRRGEKENKLISSIGEEARSLESGENIGSAEGKVNQSVEGVVESGAGKQKGLSQADQLAKFDEQLKQRQLLSAANHEKMVSQASGSFMSGYWRKTFSGHGSIVKTRPTFQIPEGTSITFWGKEGSALAGEIANLIERGESEGSILKYASELKGQKEQYFMEALAKWDTKACNRLCAEIDSLDVKVTKFNPGDIIKEHRLSPGKELDIFDIGPRITVSTPTLLSDLLVPGMGEMHWSACRVFVGK